MEQEIYYQAKVLLTDNFDIINIEKNLKKIFFKLKIDTVKGDYLIFSINSGFDCKFSLDEIESLIYNQIISVLNISEIKVIRILEEKEIYD